MTSETGAERGQVGGSAAEVYEEMFVPALFRQWAVPLLDAAGASGGETLLDVGCGTGVVARAAHRRGVRATGVDLNEGMLAVARRVGPGVDWRRGAVEDLPFADGSFDRATAAFLLMFLPDPGAALAEVRRVLAPGGTVALSTWAGLDHTPGYAALVDLVDRRLGPEAAAALAAPFTLGTGTAVAEAVAPAFPGVGVEQRPGVARFPSLAAWVRTEIKGWTLADLVDDDALDGLLAEAATALAGFEAPDGTVSFATPALIATATAPGP